ncbi:MAG: glycosyltransferase family 2 protein [Alphaproteobacteria bacterium]|nr:glycosyltransferase family 2 protein [Alphaproteobacteria bacterium]
MSDGAGKTLGLSVVVPVYNGAATVGRLVAALDSLPIERGLEIVLVYDGSPDGSLQACKDAAERARCPVTVVEHARNFGEHNAVMSGLRLARGEWIVTMDDDLQNPPEEVTRLYDYARMSGKDVIYTFYAETEHAWWRVAGSRFANWIADQVIDKPKGLYLCSFRCMSAFVARQVCDYRGPFPYVDGLIFQATESVGTLEVRHLPRAVGRSNYTLKRLVRLLTSIAVNFSIKPLHLATLAGAGLSALGVLGFLVVVLEAIFWEPPPGWASLLAATLLLSGTQLLLLGIIGEYLGRLYLIASGKPQTVVRNVFLPNAKPAAEVIRLPEIDGRKAG